MTELFNKLASLDGLAAADFEDLFESAGDMPAAELGAVLGYLLGRLNSADAAALVSVVRRHHPQRRVQLRDSRHTVNIVGTGGGPSTFNITTTTAFVVAAAGVVVVKTGSHAFRSRSGFADVAARLGTMKVAMPWERIEEIAREVGIVFVPPSYHWPVLGRLAELLGEGAYRNAGGYLNKIGPLVSPVRVDHVFMGAHSPACLEMLAGACQLLGDLPATLVTSADGMDEVSSMAKSQVVQLASDGSRLLSTVDPGALGIAPAMLAEIAGHDVAEAADCCERILAGKGTQAQADIVALNAAVVLTSVGVTASVSDGLERARQILSAGEGLQKLQLLRERVWKNA